MGLSDTFGGKKKEIKMVSLRSAVDGVAALTLGLVWSGLCFPRSLQSSLVVCEISGEAGGHWDANEQNSMCWERPEEALH